MKVDGGSLRHGNVIEHKGQLWVVRRAQHVKPGKGGAYNQVELKDIRHGTKFNESFRADEPVTRVRLEQLPFQYLYEDGEHLVFMNQETFEQLSLEKEMLDTRLPFLTDNLEVTIEFYGDEPIGVTLPQHITAEVVETEPVIKGQTATSSYKPATLDNGVRIVVPPFISQGDRIVVDTGDSSYVERAKA